MDIPGEGQKLLVDETINKRFLGSEQ